jgi:hypothetical protein
MNFIQNLDQIGSQTEKNNSQTESELSYLTNILKDGSTVLDLALVMECYPSSWQNRDIPFVEWARPF